MKWVGDARLAAGPEATWYLETAFTPGARLGTVYDDPTTPVVVTSIEEVTTMRVPSGRLVVDAPWDDDDILQVDSPQGDIHGVLPALTTAGPGTYRVRVHSRGRDTCPDGAVTTPVETYLIIAWPQDPDDSPA
ncbi:hypothetical protein [Streptomyces sp. NPDC004726]